MSEDDFTEDMLNDMLSAFNEHDLDRVMSYFAEDAVMIAPAGNNQAGTPIKGREAIASAFSNRFSQQPDVAWNERSDSAPLERANSARSRITESAHCCRSPRTSGIETGRPSCRTTPPRASPCACRRRAS